MRIMVIAGTADARNIIKELLNGENEVFATVTTNYGKELLDSNPHLVVYEGKLDETGMLEYMRDKSIDLLVDASHPFAREASVNAIAACSKANISYIRFERQTSQCQSDNVIRVKSFKEAAFMANSYPGNIFLTIGSNNIKCFIEGVSDYRTRLFARVLPSSKMILKCEEEGLTAGNIIAMKGPFSIEMNMEMLKHCKAAVMVTKESGETGGTDTKLEAAHRLGIPTILVERPDDIDYGIKVSAIEEVLELILVHGGYMKN